MLFFSYCSFFSIGFLFGSGVFADLLYDLALLCALALLLLGRALMVIAEKVEDRVNGQEFDLLQKGMTDLPRLLFRPLEGNDDIAEHGASDTFRHVEVPVLIERKREHVGRSVDPAEFFIQGVDIRIVTEGDRQLRIVGKTLGIERCLRRATDGALHFVIDGGKRCRGTKTDRQTAFHIFLLVLSARNFFPAASFCFFS